MAYENYRTSGNQVIQEGDPRLRTDPRFIDRSMDPRLGGFGDGRDVSRPMDPRLGGGQGFMGQPNGGPNPQGNAYGFYKRRRRLNPAAVLGVPDQGMIKYGDGRDNSIIGRGDIHPWQPAGDPRSSNTGSSNYGPNILPPSWRETPSPMTPTATSPIPMIPREAPYPAQPIRQPINPYGPRTMY